MNDAATPAQLGYRFPAEWEPHAATWLSWPHRRKTWQEHFEPIPEVWAELVRTLAQFETVHVLAGSDAVMRQARECIASALNVAVPSLSTANVVLHDILTNDAWTRDHGPTFLVGPPGAPPALIDWDFNAWGHKYPAFDDDNRVPEQIAALQGRRRFRPGVVLEGGSLDTNGLGTLLTTEQCLLNPNRNPGLGRAELEQILRDYLGVHKILWLSRGVVGDDTDGHVDQLARFVGPRTVVVAIERDATDENYAALQENYQRLLRMTDQDDRPLEIIPLPMPGPVRFGATRLPASYANFYIANGLVIVPTFDDPADAQAIELLGRLFPDRQVRALRAVDLVRGRGAYHCVTQQEPALALS
jgi:agmatine deiminase